MNQSERKALLERLLREGENELTEFKQAKNDFNTNDLGKYFSALANEANLRDREAAWLVFGVQDKTRKIVGTDYRLDNERLQATKHQIAQGTPGTTFRNIHELKHDDGRVILFEIPAAPRGMPISWKGHRYARSGESLASLSEDKYDEIRQQAPLDWSARTVRGASYTHLDAQALQKAKEVFAEKYANRISEQDIMRWETSVFLDRAGLARDGQITRTTILLLGTPEAAHLLSPHPAQIVWKLVGSEEAYERFGPPFLLNTTELFKKIRNPQLRLLPQGSLFPHERAKYDQKVVLEALNNCILHQDYSRNGRIVVTESQEHLIFENEGDFFEGSPEDYLDGDKTPRRYRNTFLANAMVVMNMVDTMGYGIRQMYARQAQRYFPMPDYDLSKSQTVRITIHGKVIDPDYSRTLIEKTDLPLTTILALDRVQKKLPLPQETAKHLRQAKLIEGRQPNIYVASSAAKSTVSKAKYIRNRSFDDKFHTHLIIEYIAEFGEASRRAIDELLFDKLSDVLDNDQKKNKISNLITKLRRSGKIENKGSRTRPTWVLKNQTLQKESAGLQKEKADLQKG